jgi:hypothetical protein
MLVVQSLVPDEELASNDWEKNPPAHLWTAEGFGEGSAALLLIDGHLIFRYQDGTIALIEASPAEYKLKGNFAPDYQKGKRLAASCGGPGETVLARAGQVDVLRGRQIASI